MSDTRTWTYRKSALGFELHNEHGAWLATFVDERACALAAAAPELLEALKLMTDDEPCRYDHHGYCQTHMLGNPCEQKIARAAIRKAEAQ